MDSKYNAAVDRNDPPPAYAQWSDYSRFPQVHELSEDCCTPELPGSAPPAEMESPLEGSAESDYDNEPFAKQYPVAKYDLAINTTMSQKLLPTETPTPLRRLDMQQYPDRVPSLVLGGQSQKSSPVLPETPDTYASYGSQFQPSTGLFGSVSLPSDDVSYSQNSWTPTKVNCMEEAYASQRILGPSIGRSLTGPIASNVRVPEAESRFQRNDRRYGATEFYSEGLGMYTASNDGVPFASESFLAKFIAPSSGTISIRPGTYEYHERWGWQQSPVCDPKTDNGNTANGSFMANASKRPYHTNQSSERRQYNNYVELEEGPLPQIDLHPGDHRGAGYAEVPCNQCEAVFHGKYVKPIGIFFLKLLLTMGPGTEKAI